MERVQATLPAAGLMLALGGAALLVGGAFHPDNPVDEAERMRTIAEAGAGWVSIHYLMAAGGTVVAAGAVLLLVGNPKLIQGAVASISWSLLPIGSIIFVVLALMEAGVVFEVAKAGDARAFSQWDAFNAALAPGFSLFSLCLAGAAWSQTGAGIQILPRWASGAAVVGGILGTTVPISFWVETEPGILVAALGWGLVLALLWLTWLGVRLWLRDYAMHAAA